MKSAVIVALCAWLFGGAAAFAGEWVISPQGYGPVKIGMTGAQAAAALGMKLVPSDAEDGEVDPACHHLEAPAMVGEDISFMVENGHIARVSVYRGPLASETDKGITLGSTEAAVIAAYGGVLEIRPAEYSDGHDLIFWDAAKGRGIRYVTTAEEGASMDDPASLHVTEIHAGGEAMYFVEGCL